MYLILMTCVIKDDDKFHLQLFIEEALLEAQKLLASLAFL